MMNSMTISHSDDAQQKPIYTQTSEGLIRGKKIFGYECAVKTEAIENDRELPRPKRTPNGNLIYAIPGGGSFSNGEFLD